MSPPFTAARRAPARRRLARFAAIAGAATAAAASPARAQGPGEVPALRPPPAEADLAPEGPLVRFEVVSTDPAWPVPVPERFALRPGELASGARLRRAARELVEGGMAAEVGVESWREGAGVAVRFVAVARRRVAAVRVRGDADVSDVLRASGVERGRALTPPLLRAAEAAAVERLKLRGYPLASVRSSLRETDDPRAAVVLVDVSAWPPRLLAGVRREVVDRPPSDRAAAALLAGYAVGRGDLADEEALDEADRALGESLRARGYVRAAVEHRLYEANGRTYALVSARLGPLVGLVYEGNRALDADQLNDVVDLEKESDRTPSRVEQKVREQYRRLGFYDVEVAVEVRGGPDEPVNHWAVRVREGERVRVVSRAYPCLNARAGGPGEGWAGARRARELDDEIDSFLEEDLPGATLLGPVDPRRVAELYGPGGTTGARPAPLELKPREVFAPESYDRAIAHLEDLYRAEGYLSVLVGPLQVLRRRCDPRSPPGLCRPLPPPPLPEPKCAFDSQGLPLEEPPLPREALCRPDPARGLRCEPEVALRIPVRPGPRARLHDVAFEGAVSVPETELFEASGLKLGDPASNVAVDAARRAILDRYRDDGYAFAEVRAGVELSPDKQRARVRFVVVERQRVVVGRVIVRGAEATDEATVLGRLRLAPGDPYRQQRARQSEELLATLGVFSSVTIALEDPEVPATRKNVVVTVVERRPQYLEFRPGLSSGEGVRGLLEYGHRNVGGRAIQLTLRLQANYLPTFFIPEQRVRENFDRLSLTERIERRNSLGLQFPDVFHPALRLGVDLIDVRDNARDFGLTKHAVLPALTFRPERQVAVTLGASLERNDVRTYSGESIDEYVQGIGTDSDLARLLRVPDGLTLVVAQRVSATWDRRDNPLGATRGTLLTGSVEHAHAYPIDTSEGARDADFLRWTGGVGGYVRLSERGLAFALLLRGGVIQHLIRGSQTYPDRLFFLGGYDSFRGLFRDSLLPQDLADEILARPRYDQADPELDQWREAARLAVRGGDVFLNPRSELRVPLWGPLETTLFVDAGNVWVDPARIEPWRLRYAAGSGLRFATPIGPVALDYGINLDPRPWEGFGTFHFSIGLF
ncbi:MAG TPA: POTRA domain-containing protein [Polyangiaceae bacterium]|nr:POTRA domain-containing protein [Polyangiaceae bacterium]